MHLILVASSFWISVDELLVDEWGEAGIQVDFGTPRKFVSIQTTFNSRILGRVLSW